jgi:putative hydroxymethylpyrimidine transport system substrate-binding protein
LRRLAPLLLAALALAGCGERHEALSTGDGAPLRVATIFPNAGEAPVYAGNFRVAGLDVTTRDATTGAAAAKAVADGKADLAVSTLPDLLEAREKGLAVIAVAALVLKPLSSVIRLGPEKGLQGFADRPVGTRGLDYQRAFAEAALGNPKVVNVGSDLTSALTSRKVTAIVGGYSNYEGVDLRRRHKKPQVTTVDQAGVPSYPELVLVANADALQRDGDLIRSYVGALARATYDLRRGNRQAVAAWVKAGTDRHIDPGLQRDALALTLPQMLSPKGKPYGWLDPAEMARVGRWMREQGVLRNAPSGAYTNDYLPGEGL